MLSPKGKQTSDQRERATHATYQDQGESDYATPADRFRQGESSRFPDWPRLPGHSGRELPAVGKNNPTMAPSSMSADRNSSSIRPNIGRIDCGPLTNLSSRPRAKLPASTTRSVKSPPSIGMPPKRLNKSAASALKKAIGNGHCARLVSAGSGRGSTSNTANCLQAGRMPLHAPFSKPMPLSGKH